ncbi:MAG: SDR family NAD(P)-dependent oxidoreductase [Solirubrobacterales bacterium]|nr:SDR family NAD(P)-dependent oxidoreductase [Solirubrobacterales bacterium]
MLIDTALDRSIVLGYGRIGLLARRRLPGWPADPPRIDGSAVLVTGAASGLGLAAAIQFAQLGATVHAHARDDDRAAEAVDAIRTQCPNADVRPTPCDLASLAAVKSFATEFAAREPRLDVLVNNAGVMPSERTRSADGHELMFATHVLAPLALTTLFADKVGRVINVSSGGMYGQSLPEGGDWESDRIAYSPKKLYARTKREQVVMTVMSAQRLRARGVVVHAMHPGWADTGGLARSMPTFRRLTGPILRTADEGADTIVWLGAAPEARDTGLFWHDRRPRPTHYRVGPRAESEGDREQLWAYCESALADAGIDPLLADAGIDPL